MRNFFIIYLGFLSISLIFYQKFSIDHKISQREFQQAKYLCLESNNEKECDFDFIFSLVQNNPDFETRYGKHVLQTNSGELIFLDTGERVDVRRFAQNLKKTQLDLFLAEQRKKFSEENSREKTKFILDGVFFSIRLFFTACLAWLLWKIFLAAIKMNFTSVMYICGFISLILAPFTGITVVTAAAFFVIGWIFDSDKK
jgi:hypothetical protein